MLKTILTIGDVMLDHFSYGRVKRLNPEAPTQLINIEREEYKLGGAANVAANVAAMGVKSILIGKIGNDSHGQIFQDLCKNHDIQLEAILGVEPTTTKSRIIETTYHQQLFRMDREKVVNIDEKYAVDFQNLIKKLNPSLIIISDYQKGMITEAIGRAIIESGIPTLVDAKPGRMQWFKGAYAIKPNFKEFSEHIGKSGVEDSDAFIEEFGPSLARSLESNLVITRSEKGASVVENGTVFHMSTEAQEIFDVTGAGDTFIAAMGVGITEGMSLTEAAKLGNKASGIAVGKVGTVVVSKETLQVNL